MKRAYRLLILPYSVGLLYMMFFGCGRSACDLGYLQPNPFQTIYHFLNDPVDFYAFMLNIFGNIFVFAPFGFLGWIWRPFQRLNIILPYFILTITTVEILQYISHRGTADVDDIFLNTLGMLIGYFLMIKNKWAQHERNFERAIS